jgi:hypothetical protein
VTHWRRAVVEIAVIGLAAVMAWIPLQAEAVETWFSTGIYPPLQQAVTSLSNVVPVALLDVLSVTAGAGVLWILVRAVIEVRRVRRIGPVVNALRVLVTAGAAVYLVFLLLWGLNYRRLPMSDRVQLTDGAVDPAAVEKLGLETVQQLNALHAEAHRDGWIDSPLEDEALRRGFVSAQAALSDVQSAAPGRLKRTMFGPYFRWTGVDGMINPFGLEVLSNPDLLPFERPFVAAHEWSHLAGYADESEANFVGFLTCMKGSVATQYSGWLFLYWQVSSEVDGEARSRLSKSLAEGPRRDLEAIVTRLRTGELPWLRTAGWRVYDGYLKANRVEEGIRSYGAVLTLIVKARFEPGWTPVRRTRAKP